MHAHPLFAFNHLIAYADQKRRKVFVFTEDRSSIIPPDVLRLEDKAGNAIIVPVDVHGDMTVIDVQNLSAGGYFVRILGMTSNAIRIILF